MRSITVNEAPVSMARKKSRRFEVKLGLVQTLVLLGFVSGSMACAFYFGYFSGQSMGFDLAMRESLESAVRLPIADAEIGAEARQEIATDVYAKLSHKGGRSKKQLVQEEIPSLGSIQSTQTAPLDIPEVKPGENQIAMNSVTTPEHEAASDLNAGSQEIEVQKNLENIPRAASEELPPPGVRVLGSASLPLPGDSRASALESSPKLGNLLANTSREAERNAEETSKVITQKMDSATEVRPERTMNLDSGLKSKERPMPDGLAAKSSKPEAGPEFYEKRELKPADLEAPQKAPVFDESKLKIPSAPVKQMDSKPGSVPSGWFAQVAAPDALSDAKQLSAKLRNSGFSAHIEIAQVRGQEYYRVLVGPEGSRKHAERLLSQLDRESYLKSRPFIKFVR